MSNEIVIFERTCMVCGKPSKVEMPKAAAEAFDNGKGAFIQDAWPEATPAEREVVLSGMHSECFDSLLPEEDE